VISCSHAPSKVRMAFFKARVVDSVSRGWVVECIEGIPWPDFSYTAIASCVAAVIRLRRPSSSALGEEVADMVAVALGVGYRVEDYMHK